MLKLFNIYGSNMVVQQGTPFIIKGHTTSKIETCFISRNNRRFKPVSIKYYNDDVFEITFPSFSGSFTPCDLFIKNQKEEVKLSPLYFGDVFLLLGQSNMAYHLINIEKHEYYFNKLSKQQVYCLNILEADQDHVAYDVHRPVKPQDDISPLFSWKRLTKENEITFSGIGSIFGSILAEKVKYPVGVINTSMGGLSIESYLPKVEVDKNPTLVDMMRSIGVYYESDKEYNNAGGRNYTQLGGVYNEKVSPLKPFSFKGVIWYLGESACCDDNRAKYYLTSLKLLIKTYRNYFSNNNLPFVVIDIAECLYPYFYDNGYNLINEANSLLNLKNVFNCPIYDVEPRWLDKEDKDIYYHPIHPRNKEEIASRTVDLFMNNIYKKSNYYFPKYVSFKATEESALVTLDIPNGDKLLVGSTYFGFSVSGKDGKHYSCSAIAINNNEIKLFTPFVKEIKEISYGFFLYNYFANCKTVNGLPLIPFRSKLRKSENSCYINDQILLSCDYLSFKEDNFGYEISGGFNNDLIVLGELFRSDLKISLDKVNKTEGISSIKVINSPEKGRNYNYFSIKFNLGYSGLHHRLNNFKYLTFDVKGSKNIELHGVLFRKNGKILRFPLVDNNDEIKPLITLTNNFKKYAVTLKKYQDGSECVYDVPDHNFKEEIVGIELYFRCSKKCSVNIDNLVLCDDLTLIDKNVENNLSQEVDNALVIPKNN